MTEREKEIYIATKQGDMCVNVVAVIAELVQQMLDYCKEHNIKIDRIEKRNWEFLIKTAKQLESMSYNLSKEQKIIFDRNTKMFSLQSETASIKPQVMQELKDRFKKVYILYDNDFKNEEEKGNNPGREAAKAIAEQFDIVQIEIPTSYKAKDSSDLFKQYGKDIFLKVFKQLIK